MIPTYNDIEIGSWDLAYIKRLSEELWIDAWDAELHGLYDGWPIANDIIYYILFTAVLNLEISDESKDKLKDSIYINRIDSWFIIEADEFPKKEREEVENFLSLL